MVTIDFSWLSFNMSISGILIKLYFHLFIEDNDGNVIQNFPFKTHGGRLMLLYLVGMFIFYKIKDFEFIWWQHILISMGIALLWDVITYSIFRFRVKRFINQFYE
jgi:hypothetical protein